MNVPEVRIGTRGSALALVQARLVREALGQAGERSQIVVIETEGDRRAPDTAWGEGAFVAAIERALLAGHVDVAVHSAKDVPTGPDPRLRIGAYLPRADPRDALVVRVDALQRRLDDLPPASRVGTVSPRPGSPVTHPRGGKCEGGLLTGRPEICGSLLAGPAMNDSNQRPLAFTPLVIARCAKRAAAAPSGLLRRCATDLFSPKRKPCGKRRSR